ncbi:MAG: hypothetical protein HUJ79_07105, partial [Firmicutes bacterium]|nr:hypothetical protein [Bacillota bacterium]
YPDELESAAKIKAENVSATRAKLSWSAVPLAQTYVVMKQNAATGKYQEVQTVEEGATETEITRDIGKYAVKAKAVVKGKEITGKRSEHVNVEGTFENAKAYRSSKIIMRLNSSTVDLVREIHGDGNARVPQSLSKKDDCYVVSYVSSGGSSGKFISYRRDGELAAINNASGMGYANGTTYNPNTNKFYVVKTHKSIRTASCSTYNGDTKEFAGSFSLPKVTSGIAYDESNNKYYLSKGNELYVCDNQFKVEKFIHKFIRYNHAQDIGAYNGVIFVCTWVSGNTSYIDLYRISDGAYLGTIDACIGEVESVIVDDGYLVILMNRLGTSDDYIYKTKERFTLE